MQDIEKLFREELKKVIGNFCPTDKCLGGLVKGLSFAMARAYLSELSYKDSREITEEMTSLMQNYTEMDEGVFKKSLYDTVLFTSQGILTDTLKKTFSSVRYATPLATRVEVTVNSTGNNKVSKTLPDKKPRVISNEADFDILDIDSIPKVSPEALRTLREQQTSQPTHSNRIPKVVSNEFEGVDLEETHETPKKREVVLDDFRSDASKFTDGKYDSVPSMSVDLDY